MEASARHAPVRLDGDTRCQSCGERLAAGDVAAIDAISNTIVCFACAYLRLEHTYGAAILFVLGVALLVAALFRFGQEVRITLSEADHYR